MMFLGFAAVSVLAFVRIIYVAAETVVLIPLPAYDRPTCPKCRKTFAWAQEVQFRSCLSCLVTQQNRCMLLWWVCTLGAILLYWWETSR